MFIDNLDDYWASQMEFSPSEVEAIHKAMEREEAAQANAERGEGAE